MRRILFYASWVLLCAAVSDAQSLGEIAKKEKERRKSVQKKDASKVITEKDLVSGDRSESADSSNGAGESVDDERPGRPSIPDVVNPTGDNASDANSVKDQWTEIFAQYQEAYREAKAGLDFYLAFQKHCEDGTPPPPLPPVLGGYWMINCDSFPEGVAEFRKSMKDIENACYNHARRLGIPPGRARLR